MTDSNTNAGATGAEARDDASRAAHRAADDIKNLSGEATERVREEAYAQGDRAKASVAAEMSGIADALRKAADDMRSGSPQERTIGQLAGGLADASEAIRDRDLGEIAADLSGFARRNPVAFLGGAALAGFAATRFVKASASTPRSTGTSHDNAVPATRPSATTPSATTPSATSSSPADRIPAPTTQPATTSAGTGAVAAPVTTTTYNPGERR